MSYYFTEEHDLFRQGVRQFLEKEVIPYIDEWEEKGEIPKSLWKKFGDMGYLGLNYPEQYGGSDADFFYSVVLLEEAAKCRSGGFTISLAVQQYLASPYIYEAGSDYLKEKYLPKAISGEWLCCIAISEPGAGSDVANIQTRAQRLGDHYVLNGSKIFITNGYLADFMIVAAKTDPDAGASGISLFVVDADTPGISRSKLNKLGWHASDTAEIFFEDVKVPAENLIGKEGRGFYYIMDTFQLERLAGSIMGIGAMDDALAMTLNYMAQREAFGRPINKFQVLRHRIADLATRIEAARYFLYHICRMHQDGQFAVKECSMAKLLITELSDKVMYECLQCFGGYGYIEDYKIARMFRDSRIGTIGGGSSEIMREIIAKMVIDDVRYDKVYGGQPSPGGGKPPVNGHAQEAASETNRSARDIIQSLGERFRPEKAGTSFGVFHFDIAGTRGGRFTVHIESGTCKVKEGLAGEAACVVEVEDVVYEAVELGKMNPQEALFSGKLQVSNLGEMMKFSSWFRRL